MRFYEYSTAYHPPAPVCPVYLGAAGDTPTLGPLEALLDTGADVTLIPTALLHQVGAQAVSTGKSRGVWGGSRPVRVYAVALRVETLHFTALQVVENDASDELILGRHVLGRFQITLDGPAGMVDIIE